MCDEAGLRALVIIRRHDEEGRRADALGVFREVDGIGRVIRARARDDGDAAFHLLAGKLDGRAVLGIRHRGSFARRARDDDGVRPARDLVLDEARELRIIDAIFRERRDEGDACARKNLFFH